MWSPGLQVQCPGAGPAVCDPGQAPPSWSLQVTPAIPQRPPWRPRGWKAASLPQRSPTWCGVSRQNQISDHHRLSPSQCCSICPEARSRKGTVPSPAWGLGPAGHQAAPQNKVLPEAGGSRAPAPSSVTQAQDLRDPREQPAAGPAPPGGLPEWQGSDLRSGSAFHPEGPLWLPASPAAGRVATGDAPPAEKSRPRGSAARPGQATCPGASQGSGPRAGGRGREDLPTGGGAEARARLEPRPGDWAGRCGGQVVAEAVGKTASLEGASPGTYHDGTNGIQQRAS